MTDRDAAPPGVRIESGDADDADAVADYWVELAESQRDHGSRLLADRNRNAAREAAIRHAVAGGLFVARRTDAGDAEDVITDAEILGFVTASFATGDFAETADRGVVQNIYVHPAARGRGIGTALLAAAEAYLREQGAAVVSLEVLADNESARRFYRRHGYENHRVELQKDLDD
ncbi:MAG: GNAT family N-acetyltransferase [Haloglomus sp.]